MSEPLSAWLSLREAADAAARSGQLVAELAGTLARHQPLRVLDLATGTGSNIRYLAPRFRRSQQWLAVDRDVALLSEVPRRIQVAGARDVVIETERLELGTLDRLDIFAGRHLVTASALLDLVSSQWIVKLATVCREVGAAALFALSYDGRSTCVPREPEDEDIRELFNRHQRSNDKGFGVAAGPDAARLAREAFQSAGFEVRWQQTDWVLPPESRDLQRELVEGWAHAAVEIAPERADWVAAWRARRLDHVNGGRSQIVVGHEDFLATR